MEEGGGRMMSGVRRGARNEQDNGKSSLVQSHKDREQSALQDFYRNGKALLLKFRESNKNLGGDATKPATENLGFYTRGKKNGPGDSDSTTGFKFQASLWEDLKGVGAPAPQVVRVSNRIS